MFATIRAAAAATSTATYCKPLLRLGRGRDVRNPLYAAGIGSSPSWMSTMAGKKTYVRKLLPPELSSNVVMLKYGKTDVYVVGTSHGSKESHQQVEAVIKFLKPRAIFLELCDERAATVLPIEKQPKMTMAEVWDMWKRNRSVLLILYNFAYLATVKNAREDENWCEFRVAYEVASTYGAKVYFSDRNIRITWRRFWTKMPLWHKIKIILAIPYEEGLSSEDPTKMVKEIDGGDEHPISHQDFNPAEFPTYKEIMIDERDQYMAVMLKRVAMHHKSVVAVVGRAHLPGIKKNWKRILEVDHLLSAPSATMMRVSYGVTFVLAAGFHYFLLIIM